MPQYVVLMNLTAKGLADLKDAPRRIEENISGLAASGSKVISFNVTMGHYDYVAIVEGPSDEVAAVSAMALAAQGYVTTHTMRAFSQDEFAALVGQLP